MTAFFIIILVAAAIAALVGLADAKRRIAELEQSVKSLTVDTSWMRRELRELRRDAAPRPQPEKAPQVVEKPTAAPPEKPPAPEPPPEPRVVVPQWETPPPPSVTPEPAAAAASSAAPQPEAAAPEPPAPPPPPIAPPRPPAPAPPPSKPFDWESVIGVKLFSWIAGVALVLAALFFLRYSVEQGWFSPTVRATIGLLTGIVLLVVCEMRVARDYSWTANAMHGAGVAILYATLFSMHALWHLAPAGVVFFLMIVVTAVAVMLSIRRDSVFIALLGMMGGFATPALLSTGENRPIGLFSYLLLLNVGLAWVAWRKNWPALTVGSFLFTVIYQWVWVGKFLSASQLPLAAGIFVLFAIAGTSSMWKRTAGGENPSFRRIALASAVVPLAFAIFGAAVPAYGARYNVLFAFLFLMVAGLAAVAFMRGPGWLHAVGGAATVLTFAIWGGVSYTPAAWPAVLGWLAAFILLYLGVGFFAKATDEQRLARYKVTPREGAYAAALLFFMFPLLAAREPATASAALLFGAAIVLLLFTAVYAVVKREGLVYFGAAFFTVLAEAVWSAKYLTAERLLSALIVYASFAIVFLAVPVIARRAGRPLQPEYGVAGTVAVSLLVLLFLTSHAIAAAALWGLALLLSILIGGTFIESRATSRPLVAGGAIVLAWIVLAAWWSSAPLAIALFPALFVIALFGTIVILGSLWASRGGEANSAFGYTTFLAFAGHLFLLFVAGRVDLAVPPWPLFGVLFVLALGIGTAALYLRRGGLVVGATIATQLVLMMWAGTAQTDRWPVVALVATLVAAAYPLIWSLLGRRVSLDRSLLVAASIAGLLSGNIVALIAGDGSKEPMFAPLLGTHAILFAVLLAVAWRTEIQMLAVVGALGGAIATVFAHTTTPGQELTFAAVLYALFIAYPLLLGRRARQSFEPYLGAVIASAAFFFFARDAMLDMGLGWMIGVLPVGEALVMMALLARVIAFEPREERNLARLAVIAATALAFITAAVPLQLEKQWITIAWALEAAALVWLFHRIPHRGLLAWSAALFVAVFVRLMFNPALLQYHPVSRTAILNWYLYTYLVAAAACFIATYLWPRDVKWGREATASAGTILLFALLNIEIADFYSTGRTLTFNFFSSSLAQDLTYTFGWALFAIAMLVCGIALRQRAVRVAAILLLVVTILKCFLHDLARLGGLYRVASLLGLAASLVVVGLLLQRFVMRRAAEKTVKVEEQPA